MIGISFGDIIKAIELLLKGFDLRLGSRRRLFLDHIDPCFQSLISIQEDYEATCRILIAKAQNIRNLSEYKPIREFLREARNTKAITRKQIEHFSEEWEKNQKCHVPLEARSFFEA